MRRFPAAGAIPFPTSLKHGANTVFTLAPLSGSASAFSPQMLLIHRAGFVLAQAALFVCVARGFGSVRPARDFAIGIALALGVFLFFVKFLNVNLPAGWLQPILGTAGI